MVLDQAFQQDRCLSLELRVEFDAAKCCLRSCQGGFSEADACAFGKHLAVDTKDEFGDRQVVTDAEVLDQRSASLSNTSC